MSEQAYDEVIAPALLELAKKCEELGLAFVARVDWDSGYGVTQKNVEHADIGMKLTHLAAHSKGNIDLLCMEALRRFDCSQSAFLRLHQQRQQER